MISMILLSIIQRSLDL